MFFRTKSLAIAALFVLGVGCGNRESPKPPPQMIPQPVRDLAVTQRGDNLRISFTYPQTTISGLPLDEIMTIEVWVQEMPVPDFNTALLGDDPEGESSSSEDSDGVPDGTESDGTELEGTESNGIDSDDSADEEIDGKAASASVDLQLDPDDLDDPANALNTTIEGDLPGDNLDPLPEPTFDSDELADGDAGNDDQEDEALDAGPKVSPESLLEIDAFSFVSAARIRINLEGEELSNAISGDKIKLTMPLDKIEPGEKTALIIGVKSLQSLKRVSGLSNLARIIPRVLPEPPRELGAEPVSNGIRLSWTFEGEKPEEFRFYRRDVRFPGYGDHFGTQGGDVDRFLDSQAVFGQKFAYVMTAVINRNPLVETLFSEEIEVEYTDEFPPEPPTDLVVFAEVGKARLLWESSGDDDVVGYHVYRRNGPTDPERLTDKPVTNAEFEDKTASSGRTYAYRVVAVDEDGNFSDPSEEVEVRIP